jgi:sugar lactone lactonase YvrE
VTPVSISLGESATLEWSSRYASTCTAYDAWTGLQSLSGTSSVTPQSTGVFTFHLVCKGYQGTAPATATLSVQVAAGTVPLAARFCSPLGLAIDAADDLYVADSGNNTIRKISHDGVVSSVAGLKNYPGFVDGLGASARFTAPVGVGADATGKIFVGDSYSIRQLASDGYVTTLAGAPSNQMPADGTGPAAGFSYLLYAVAPDASGNVYVGDFNASAIRKVTPEGVVTTIAGVLLNGGSADGIGTAARFWTPSGLVVLPSGDIYVADQHNHTIRKIAPGAAGGVVVTTFAGTAGVQGSADGAGAAARFYHPFAIAVDSQGNLFVTDKENRKIRKITPEGVVSTFAGSGVHDSVDGTGTAASFRYPAGIAIDSADNVYVAEGNAIRKITPAGVVTTFAGQAAAPCGSNN